MGLLDNLAKALTETSKPQPTAVPPGAALYRTGEALSALGAPLTKRVVSDITTGEFAVDPTRLDKVRNLAQLGHEEAAEWLSIADNIKGLRDKIIAFKPVGRRTLWTKKLIAPVFKSVRVPTGDGDNYVQVRREGKRNIFFDSKSGLLMDLPTLKREYPEVESTLMKVAFDEKASKYKKITTKQEGNRAELKKARKKLRQLRKEFNKKVPGKADLEGIRNKLIQERGITAREVAAKTKAARRIPFGIANEPGYKRVWNTVQNKIFSVTTPMIKEWNRPLNPKYNELVISALQEMYENSTEQTPEGATLFVGSTAVKFSNGMASLLSTIGSNVNRTVKDVYTNELKRLTNARNTINSLIRTKGDIEKSRKILSKVMDPSYLKTDDDVRRAVKGITGSYVSRIGDLGNQSDLADAVASDIMADIFRKNPKYTGAKQFQEGLISLKRINPEGYNRIKTTFAEIGNNIIRPITSKAVSNNEDTMKATYDQFLNRASQLDSAVFETLYRLYNLGGPDEWNKLTEDYRDIVGAGVGIRGGFRTPALRNVFELDED